MLRRLLRAHAQAATYVADAANRAEVTALLAAPNRIAVDPDTIRRTLEGRIEGRRRRHDPRERALSHRRARERGAARPDAGGVAVRADGALGPGADVGRDCWPRRRRCSAPISTTRRCRTKPAARRASRPTASAPLPGPPSTATTSLRTSPPRKSDAGRLRSPLAQNCALHNYFCRIARNKADRRSARALAAVAWSLLSY